MNFFPNDTGNENVTKELIEKGTNVDLQDEMGKSALFLASEFGKWAKNCFYSSPLWGENAYS